MFYKYLVKECLTTIYIFTLVYREMLIKMDYKNKNKNKIKLLGNMGLILNFTFKKIAFKLIFNQIYLTFK